MLARRWRFGILMVLLAAGSGLYVQFIYEHWQDWRAHNPRLEHEQVLGDLVLPAGTRVHLQNLEPFNDLSGDPVPILHQVRGIAVVAHTLAQPAEQPRAVFDVERADGGRNRRVGLPPRRSRRGSEAYGDGRFLADEGASFNLSADQGGAVDRIADCRKIARPKFNKHGERELQCNG